MIAKPTHLIRIFGDDATSITITAKYDNQTTITIETDQEIYTRFLTRDDLREITALLNYEQETNT